MAASYIVPLPRKISRQKMNYRKNSLFLSCERK
nr:MAG TPA: hypothetical protein [Bacteriophage sp.]